APRGAASRAMPPCARCARWRDRSPGAGAPRARRARRSRAPRRGPLPPRRSAAVWSCPRRCGRSGRSGRPARRGGPRRETAPARRSCAPRPRAGAASRDISAGCRCNRAASGACSTRRASEGGMHRAPHSRRYAWIEENAAARRDSFAQAVEDGLDGEPLSLPCRFFYDAEGSRLFEAICELPEYYLTRAEHEILARRAGEIAARCPTPLFLAELGSGSATKTRVLIEAFLRQQGRLRYVPVDISKSMLEESAQALLADYHGPEIPAIASEYRDGLRHLGKDTRLPKLIAWLGSNIGNFTRSEAQHFVGGIRDAMSADDRLLLGVDLRKDAGVLWRAYDDAQGVTARFNKNLLARINREL